MRAIGAKAKVRFCGIRLGSISGVAFSDVEFSAAVAARSAKRRDGESPRSWNGLTVN